ncbi:uncharacterized protein BJ212DRAFT_603118 [Suillus subaureus]|uniref:Uncharacterized protein n=1 Tax=Suillus subaureus TaxID=48587 RepID=A0A9P7J8T6_9AGAM|nr:uncharacterized protein BJ212DRAFT_603118 [Suillus subaureus]KAG1809318.1 hypothetical protein BJ212DRAFT_603118 [Suillus subaureus]
MMRLSRGTYRGPTDPRIPEAHLIQIIIYLFRVYDVLPPPFSASRMATTSNWYSQLNSVTFRCMRGVSDLDVYAGPTNRSEIQPSPLHAHPSIRKVVISLWGLVVACAGWGVLVLYIYDTKSSKSYSGEILMSEGCSVVDYGSYPLGCCLHCSEHIANVIRDAGDWGSGTGQRGITLATNPRSRASQIFSFLHLSLR